MKNAFIVFLLGLFAVGMSGCTPFGAFFYEEGPYDYGPYYDYDEGLGFFGFGGGEHFHRGGGEHFHGGGGTHFHGGGGGHHHR